MWSLGRGDPYRGSRDSRIRDDRKIDIHLVIGIAIVMKLFGDVNNQNRLCFKLG